MFCYFSVSGNIRNIMESSGQSTNIATMFADLGHQVSLLDEEVEGRALAANVRDRILLSLTAIQNDVDSRSSSASHQKVETTFICRGNLEMLVTGLHIISASV